MRLMVVCLKLKMRFDERSRWRVFMASVTGSWRNAHYMPYLAFAGLPSFDLVKVGR